MDSVEIVPANDTGKVVLGHALPRCGHVFELGETHRIVNTLFEQVQLRLAHTHLTVHFEQALSSIVEGVEADRLELEVLRMATEHVECFGLGLLWVTGNGAVRVASALVPDDFLAALVEVGKRKYQGLLVYRCYYLPRRRGDCRPSRGRSRHPYLGSGSRRPCILLCSP